MQSWVAKLLTLFCFSSCWVFCEAGPKITLFESLRPRSSYTCSSFQSCSYIKNLASFACFISCINALLTIIIINRQPYILLILLLYQAFLDLFKRFHSCSPLTKILPAVFFHSCLIEELLTHLKLSRFFERKSYETFTSLFIGKVWHAVRMQINDFPYSSFPKRV